MNRVSVLIPLYNCEKTIRRSLVSLQNQTYKDFEVVIVDNNCTDSTMEIVSEFFDVLDINVVKCEVAGIVPALNTGLQYCNLDFIARQDGDDYWYPEKLEKQIRYLDENPHIGVLGTQIQLLDENGNLESLGTMGKEVKYPTQDEVIKQFFIYGQNALCHPSVVVRRHLFLISGGYEMFYPKAEDLQLWLKLLPHTQFANLGEVLVDYTQRKDEDYDARVPVVMSDSYYSLYKMFGLITGEKEKRTWDWQRDPSHHGNKSKGVP
jgi:glycosyltransferase involved in cell wall biosynthesis